MVVDADALTALAGPLDRLRGARAARCLTPHPARWRGCSASASPTCSATASPPRAQFATAWERARRAQGRDERDRPARRHRAPEPDRQPRDGQRGDRRRALGHARGVPRARPRAGGGARRRRLPARAGRRRRGRTARAGVARRRRRDRGAARGVQARRAARAAGLVAPRARGNGGGRARRWASRWPRRCRRRSTATSGPARRASPRDSSRGLGVSTGATSPTFVLVNEYRGRLPVHHVDAYRTTSLTELRRSRPARALRRRRRDHRRVGGQGRAAAAGAAVRVRIDGVGDEPRADRDRACRAPRASVYRDRPLTATRAAVRQAHDDGAVADERTAARAALLERPRRAGRRRAAGAAARLGLSRPEAVDVAREMLAAYGSLADVASREARRARAGARRRPGQGRAAGRGLRADAPTARADAGRADGARRSPAEVYAAFAPLMEDLRARSFAWRCWTPRTGCCATDGVRGNAVGEPRASARGLQAGHPGVRPRRSSSSTTIRAAIRRPAGRTSGSPVSSPSARACWSCRSTTT